MAEEIRVDEQLFLARAQRLNQLLKKSSDAFGGATALQLVHGKKKEAPPGERPDDPFVVSAQQVLLGYEFPDTIMVLANDTVYVHASAKKLDFIRESEKASEAQGPNGIRVKCLLRERGDINQPANRAAVDELLNAIKESGGKLGHFPTDPLEGPLASGWVEEVTKADIKYCDSTPGIERFFAINDEAALTEIKKAGVLTARIMKYVLLGKMEEIVDQEVETTNLALATSAAEVIDDRDALHKARCPVETNNYDCVLGPVVQSGGVYNINLQDPSVASSDAKLSPDVFLMSLGMRFKGHRALCTRTYIIDSTPMMKAVYMCVSEAQYKLIEGLKPGVVIKDVVTAVRDEFLAKLQATGIEMTAKLGRNFGSAIGPRLSDRYLVLNARNETVVQEGMSFYVNVSLSDIVRTDKHEIPNAKINDINTYAISVADTVIVTSSGAEVVTERAGKSWKDVGYEMAGEDEDEDEDDEVRPQRQQEIFVSGGRDKTGRSSRIRELSKTIDPEIAQRRIERQQELLRQKMEEAKGKKVVSSVSDAEKELANAPEISAYSSITQYPPRTRPNQIIVDRTHDSVLLPILGTLVPFHISTIRSVTKSDEGSKSYLRFTFYSLGTNLKDAPLSVQALALRYPSLVFIRNLAFVSRDGRNFSHVEQSVKAMLKKSRQDRKDEAESAGIVEQPRVVPVRGLQVPPINGISVWPPISGRKTQGSLSAHSNGFLFTSNKGERIEIIYNNISVGAFVPCIGTEHNVTLHFHLKHPILIGKKKHQDIQFFTDVFATSEELDKKQRSEYDPDEFGEEDRERELRRTLNQDFLRFVRRTEDLMQLDGSSFRSFDIAQEEMVFIGAPGKEMTNCRLTSNAILAVGDKPPQVVPIDDIEFCHFERIVHGGKSFDWVLVLKKGVKPRGEPEFVRIIGIEMKYLEDIKAWVTDIADLIYYETGDSLHWEKLIPEQVRRPDFWRTIDDDTGEEKLPGMMGVLHDVEEVEMLEEEDEDTDAYEEGSDSEVSEEESDEDSEFDELVSEDESSGEEEEEDDDGEDWDELERAAEAEDRKRRRKEEEEEREARANKKSSGSRRR